MEDSHSSLLNLGILDTVTEDDQLHEILDSYNAFCNATQSLLLGSAGGAEFVSHVHTLCKHGLESLVRDHFLKVLEETFQRNGASRFWRHFVPYAGFFGLNENDDINVSFYLFIYEPNNLSYIVLIFCV
jgi:anaphase-promoting complex subunit 2